jgi:hypothetical protein
MARKLMDKFNIEEGLYESLVSGSEASRQAAYDTIMQDMAFSRKDFKGTEFFIRIAQAVEYICDVRLRQEWRHEKNPQVRTDKYGNPEEKSLRHCLDFLGLPRDVAIAKSLYLELIATMHAMARVKYGKGWSRDHNSYAWGVGVRLKDRAYETAEARKASPGDEEAAKAGAIVICKDRMLDRYVYEKLHGIKPEWMKTEEDKKRELARQEEWRAESKRNAEIHEEKMKNDSKYRREYEREKKKWANRKGRRGRTVDQAAYDAGYTDAAEVSLGTNGIYGTKHPDHEQGKLE